MRDDGWPQGLAIYYAEEPLGTEADVVGRKDGPRRVVMGYLAANGRLHPAAASMASATCAGHFLR